MMWKDIPNFEGYYMASESGQIKSVSRCVIHKNGKVYHVKERILKPARYTNGYRFVILCKDGKHTQRMIHRIVMETFRGCSTLEVNHKDGNKDNNALSNLEYVTHSQNQLHSYRVLKRQPVAPYKGKSGFEHNKSVPVVVENVITGELDYYGSFRLAQEAGFSRTAITKLINTNTPFKGKYIFRTL